MIVIIGLVLIIIIGYVLYHYIKNSGVIKDLSKWLEEIEDGIRYK